MVNGCCWLNHSGGKKTVKFIELVRKHRCIKAWFSGHFHLGQDYQDSTSWLQMPSALSDDPAPSARPVPPGAQAAPTHPGAQPEHLGSPPWPQRPASGRPN